MPRIRNIPRPRGKGVRKPKSRSTQAFWAGNAYIVRGSSKGGKVIARRPSDGKVASVNINASKEQIRKALNESNRVSITRSHFYGAEKGHSKQKAEELRKRFR